MQTEDQQQQPASDEITQTLDDGQQQNATQNNGGDQHDDQNQGSQQEGEGKEGEDEGKKPEVTAAEKEAKALKRRIDRLTKNKYQSEAQMQQMQQEISQLRAKYGQGSDDEAAANAQTITPANLQQQAREMIEFERINARCDDVVAAGESAYTDFGEKVRELGQELPLFDQSGKPAAILQTILDAEDPAALIYHLGANPDEAAELADMTPRQQMRRLIQIESEIGKPSEKPAEAPAQQRNLSKAPPPVQPNRSAAGQFQKDPEKMSDSEWWASQRKSQ